ncbi:MAG: DNA polymerase III subunit delta' [Anaerocolumna sp.]
MSDFNQITGHESTIAHLKTAIQTNKLSHAYIFSGEDGMGKNLLANAFVHALQCEDRIEGARACGKCKSCVQAESFNHPDIIRVTHEKASIGVDDIRLQLNNDIQIKPYSSKYKVYIIDEAEKLTEQAQNALLKTLEEPPSYGLIVLLTNNLNTLLQTILSRCVTLKLKAVDQNKIKEFLMAEHKIPDYLAELSAVFAQGNVGRALQFASSEEFSEMKNEVLHLLKYLDEMELYEVIERLKTFSAKKDFIDYYLDFIILWFRDVLMYKVTTNINLLIYKSEASDIAKQSSGRSYQALENSIKAIEKAKVRLNANVNFDIAIELMFLTIKENLND